MSHNHSPAESTVAVPARVTGAGGVAAPGALARGVGVDPSGVVATSSDPAAQEAAIATASPQHAETSTSTPQPTETAAALNLSAAWTQREFGDLVGISQPAVSDLLARQVLMPGESAGQWLLTYCRHLREQAAGRGGDGELANQRALLAQVQRERAEIRLAVERRQFAPVAVLEQVLAQVGRRIASGLEPLPVMLMRSCPALGAVEQKLIAQALADACDLAVNLSLRALDEPDEAGGGTGGAPGGADGSESSALGTGGLAGEGMGDDAFSDDLLDQSTADVVDAAALFRDPSTPAASQAGHASQATNLGQATHPEGGNP